MVRPSSTPPAVSDSTISSPGVSCSDSRYVRPATSTSNMWILRYTARTSPSGPMCTDVLAPRSRSGTRSAIEPATRSTPSSRAVARAQASAGPSNGSAPVAVSTGVPSSAHFSGSTTSSAPAAAAARVRRSAVMRLRLRSAVAVSWTAAARTRFSPSREIDWSVNPDAPAYRAVKPIPPARMPLIRGGRPLKSWTYVGAYGPDVMLCATRGRVGVAPSAWWAVWDRRAGELTQGRRGVSVSAGRVAVRGVFELTVGPGRAIEAVCPNGRQYAWTRKHAADARGTVAGQPVELRAIVDESAGYHARHTAWCW